jgi:hypothetical protein
MLSKTKQGKVLGREQIEQLKLPLKQCSDRGFSTGQGRGCYYAPALPYALIHRSAWNRNSANFAFIEFYEVRGLGILGSWPRIHREFIATDYSELIVASKLGLGKPGREEVRNAEAAP